MTLVVDTSVVLKWMVQESGSDAALEILTHSLIAPDLVQAELGNALKKKVRRKEISREQAEQAFREALDPVTMLPSPAFAGSAFDLSLGLNHSVYDCYFLAMAREQQVLLVTADAALVTKVRSSDLAPLILLLGEEVPDA